MPIKNIENVVLKAIAGFMNNYGGVLLIGVSDDAKILGIQDDFSLLKKRDADGFEQAIMTVIATQLGADLCQFVHVIFHQIAGKTIYRIFISQSPRQVYFTRKGNPQFYLRTGGGAREMNIQDATEFIRGRWS